MKFQKWWSDMAQKYGWESAEGGNWEIDFDTCDIYLNA
jgi:CXXX repeat modification system protein